MPVSQLRVAVISLEMDVVELKYIFEKQASDFVEKKTWNENVRIYSFDDGTLQAYEKVIQESKPDVVIIDSLSEMATEDLKETEARAIMKWFKKMRRTYGCAFIVIHHNRKANDSNKKPRKLSDLYGSFIFAKLSETVVSLWQDEGKDYLELDMLKARFDRSVSISITRSPNLTFSLKEGGSHVIDNPDNPLLDFGHAGGKDSNLD
jgi:archaellum biogenesis ATPase FlaH